MPQPYPIQVASRTATDRHAWWHCIITSMQAPFGAPCPSCCNHRAKGCGCRLPKAAR